MQTFAGGKGNDTLDGGNDDDTYLLQTTGGIDTIIDHTGANQIQIDGTPVSGQFKPAIDGGQFYYTADKTYELRPMLGDDWRLSKRDATTGEYKAVADIDGWQDGDFGLTKGAVTPVNDIYTLDKNDHSATYLRMDGSLATKAVQFVGGTKGNSFYGSVYNDDITVGTGINNFVVNAYDGNDKVKGSPNKDYIRTGRNGSSVNANVSDNDLASGGAQTDILVGGYGSDQLWGDSPDNSDWLIDGAESGNQGDWLSGENGNDALYGSRSRDVEFGGAGGRPAQGRRGRRPAIGGRPIHTPRILGDPVRRELSILPLGHHHKQHGGRPLRPLQPLPRDPDIQQRLHLDMEPIRGRLHAEPAVHRVHAPTTAGDQRRRQ